jgi:hypothetical protein
LFDCASLQGVGRCAWTNCFPQGGERLISPMEPIRSLTIIISIANILPLVSMRNTTISISEDLRKQLLKVAAELQARTGEKVDYNEVVRYLLSKVARDEQLFKQACAPVDADLSRVREELRRGRAEDKKREEVFEAKYA